MSELPGPGVSVRPLWPEAAGQNAAPVNQMVCQMGLPAGSEGLAPDGSFYLIFGHATPPVVITPEDADRFSEGGVLPVRVQAELMLTRARMVELRDLIDRMLIAEARAQEELNQ